MVDNVLTEIGRLKWIIVIYSAIIILLCGLLWFFTRKFSFNKAKTTLFASLYNLNYAQVFSFGLVLGRLLFVLCSAIFCESIHLGYFIILIIFSVLICVITKDYLFMVNELLNSTAIFALLFIQSSLYTYYLEVEHMFVVFLMVMLLGLFTVLYMALQSLSSYERIMTFKKKAKQEKKKMDFKIKVPKLKVKHD